MCDEAFVIDFMLCAMDMFENNSEIWTHPSPMTKQTSGLYIVEIPTIESRVYSVDYYC